MFNWSCARHDVHVNAACTCATNDRSAKIQPVPRLLRAQVITDGVSLIQGRPRRPRATDMQFREVWWTQIRDIENPVKRCHALDSSTSSPVGVPAGPEHRGGVCRGRAVGDLPP